MRIDISIILLGLNCLLGLVFSEKLINSDLKYFVLLGTISSKTFATVFIGILAHYFECLIKKALKIKIEKNNEINPLKPLINKTDNVLLVFLLIQLALLVFAVLPFVFISKYLVAGVFILVCFINFLIFIVSMLFYNIAYISNKAPVPSLFIAVGVAIIVLITFGNEYFVYHELFKEISTKIAEALIVISCIYSINFFASRAYEND